MSTTAPSEHPSTPVDQREDAVADELADEIWPPIRRRPNRDWAISPAMQQKVRELCGSARRTPPPSPRQTVGRFEAGPRVVVVGKRSA